MATRIVLVNPPNRIPGEYFPVGLGIIAAVLKNEGYEVFVIDDNIERLSEERIVERIEELKPDLVGITGLITYYSYIKNLAHKLKDRMPLVTVVVGGPITSSVGDLLLEKTRTDIIVIGEGEITIVQLCEKIGEDDLSSIKGIWYRDGSNQAIVKNPPQERISDLDTIPMPQYDMFAMDTYLHTHGSIIKLKNPKSSMNTITSRGCPYQCTFCSKAFGNKVRYRSVTSIIDEVRFLKKEYGVDFFIFNDELFTILDKRITEFCEVLIKESMNISWSAWARPQRLKEETLKLMERAGCYILSLGIESGSQRILDDVKKKTNVEEIIDTVSRIERSGIHTHVNLMIGYPNDDLESIRDTLRLRISILNFSRPYFTFLTPLPGTALFESIKEKHGFDSIDKKEQYIEKFSNTSFHFGDALLINLTELDDNTLMFYAKTIQRDQDAYLSLIETQGIFGERLLIKILKANKEHSEVGSILKLVNMKGSLNKLHNIIGYFKKNYGLAFIARPNNISPNELYIFDRLKMQYGVLGENLIKQFLSVIDSKEMLHKTVEQFGSEISELLRFVQRHEITVASRKEYIDA
ncbi:MAG: B12-binding domain-containing radical SAM protein [Proteobacteria bacterium]|nr:B12-binding domain-containing radical SAM protein [Pseudomonadota bacterium]